MSGYGVGELGPTPGPRPNGVDEVQQRAVFSWPQNQHIWRGDIPDTPPFSVPLPDKVYLGGLCQITVPGLSDLLLAFFLAEKEQKSSTALEGRRQGDCIQWE